MRSRRAFKAIDETEGAAWLARSSRLLRAAVACRTLDPRSSMRRPSRSTAIGKGRFSATIRRNPPMKPAEETRRRNPPKKPGRPSHCYLTCSMASRRLVLDVDVGPGDAPAPKQKRTKPVGVPRPPSARPLPALLRGDCGFGAEGVMRAAEARRLAYLF